MAWLVEYTALVSNRNQVEKGRADRVRALQEEAREDDGARI